MNKSATKPLAVYLRQAEGAADRLFLIVEHPDGIAYSTQVGGCSCANAEARGYLIPLYEFGRNEGKGSALREFFLAEPFNGWGCYECFKVPGAAEKIDQLATLVNSIEYCLDGFRYPGNDTYFLELDSVKVLEPDSRAMEAWLPVFAPPYGSGWLTWGNSD